MITFIRQQERRLRQRGEDVQEHGTACTLQALNIRSDVVDDGKQGRVQRLQTSVASRQERMDML